MGTGFALPNSTISPQDQFSLKHPTHNRPQRSTKPKYMIYLIKHIARTLSYATFLSTQSAVKTMERVKQEREKRSTRA